MDHRITILVLTVFGGTLAFTVFTAMLYTSVGPDAAQASAAAAAEAAQREAPSPRERLLEALKAMDERAAQWTRDHNGRKPDFKTYPAWEQFLRKTNLAGKPGDDGLLGPYVLSTPVNPLNRLSTVLTMEGPLRPATRVPADAVPERAGFVYSVADGCFWGTNGTGKVILLRAPPPPGSTPPPVAGPPVPTVRLVPVPDNAPPATAPPATAPSR